MTKYIFLIHDITVAGLLGSYGLNKITQDFSSQVSDQYISGRDWTLLCYFIDSDELTLVNQEELCTQCQQQLDAIGQLAEGAAGWAHHAKNRPLI